MKKQLFGLTVFLGLTALTVSGQTEKGKPQKTVFIGTWYYNGIGSISDSAHLALTTLAKFKNLPIKNSDTLQFIDTTTLLVNHINKYNYKIEYKWSDYEVNGNQYWETFLIINDNKYFVHFTLDYIEMQNEIDNHRWYGRFEKAGKSKKKKAH